MTDELHIRIALILMGAGGFCELVWLSIRAHLGKPNDMSWSPIFLIGTMLLALAWPVIPFVIVLGGIGYLGHKSIGCVVKLTQRPKAQTQLYSDPEPDDGVLYDPDFVKAQQEVEELLL